MPEYEVQLVRLRPEYLTATIEAKDLDELRAMLPGFTESSSPAAWSQGSATEPAYAIAKDDKDCRLINFRD